MSGKIANKVDLISELEDVTTYGEAFSSEDWRPIDAERLKRIVEYLDRHATSENYAVDMKVDNPDTPIVSDRNWGKP